MSIYKVQLDSYDADFFQLPIACGGEAFLLDFSWDTIAQGHWDDITQFIRQLGATNPLILLSEPKNHVENTNFPQYIAMLEEAHVSYLAFSAKWQNVLLYGSGTPDWAAMIVDLDVQQSLFQSLYISINHFSKLQNFLAYMDEIDQLISIPTPDKNVVLGKLQDPYMDLFAYIEEYLDICVEADTELKELESLLYWSVTVHHEDENLTTALEVGGIHFYQNAVFKLLFDSAKDKIGRGDMSLVTIWIGIKDGVA